MFEVDYMITMLTIARRKIPPMMTKTTMTTTTIMTITMMVWRLSHMCHFTDGMVRSVCVVCSCWQNESEVDCSTRNFTEIPEHLPKQLRYLNIQGNSVSKLETWSFLGCNQLEKLDISNNLLISIDPGAFRHTSHLKELFIHDNPIVLNSPEVFSSLNESLVTLFMQNVRYSDTVFQHMPFLRNLAIDGFSNQSFGAGFSNLHQLELFSIHYKSKYITNTTFAQFSECPIKQVNIISTQLAAVDYLGFSHFHHMQVLNLSHNRYLSFDGVSNGWFGLQFTDIKKLMLTRIVSEQDQMVIVGKQFYTFLNLTNITHIWLDKNNMIQFEFGMSIFLKNLEFVDLSYNRLSNIAGLLFDVFMLQKLRVLDFSFQMKRFKFKRQSPLLGGANETSLHAFKNESSLSVTREKRYDRASCKAGVFTKCEILPSADNQSGRPLPDRNWCFLVPKNLEVINLTQSLSIAMASFPATLVLSTFKLRHIEYRANGLTSVTGPIMINRPRPSTPLTLDFSDNIISCLASDVLSYSISRGLNLVRLILAGNNLGEQLAQDKFGETFFHYRNLTELNLANNRIKTLKVGVFKNNRELLILNLSRNSLQLIEFDLKHFEKLTILDLSQNLFVGLEPSVRQDFSMLMRTRRFKVDLWGNPLQCSCDGLMFLHWLNEEKSNVLNFESTNCLFRGEMFNFTKIEDIIVNLDFNCSKTFALTISGVLLGLTLVGIFVSICLYRHRWDIRYCMLKMSHKGKKYQRLIDQTTTYKYDAFVAYDKDDRSWVRNELIPNMESTEDLNSGIEGNGMRFCIHERDFELGNWIEENIVSAIEQSRKVILVISANFLASNWCRFELEISRMQSLERGRNLVVPVLLETIDFASMPSSLQWLVRKYTYIEWTEHPSSREEFWDRLRQVLTETNSEQLVCECGRHVFFPEDAM